MHSNNFSVSPSFLISIGSRKFAIHMEKQLGKVHNCVFVDYHLIHNVDLDPFISDLVPGGLVVK